MSAGVLKFIMQNYKKKKFTILVSVYINGERGRKGEEPYFGYSLR